MADRRRRRRRASQDSEDESGSGSGSDSGRSASPSTKPPEPSEPCEADKSGERRADRSGQKSHEESECESEDGVGEAVLSDYDSADPEDNGSHSEGGEEEAFTEQTTAATEDPKTPLTHTPTPPGENVSPPKEDPRPPDEKSNVTGERQSGDGQESTDDPETKSGGKQKLDDDEDRKNPAYIPRRGLFFEHDLRGASEEERPKGRNRKLWKDEGRWEHDKFREDEQAPKSREELISIYGYDIRHGDRPRPRRPRQSTSPSRDKRRWEGGERGVRSWQSGGPARPSSQAPSTQTITHTTPTTSRTKPLPQRIRSYQQNHPPYRPNEGQTHRSATQPQPRGDRHVSPKSLEFTAGGGGVPSGRGGRGFRGTPPDDVTGVRVAPDPVMNESSGVYSHHQTQQKPLPPALPTPVPSLLPPQRDLSPSERPPERKNYSLVRRTRSRPADMGSKQASVEEANAPSPKLGWVAAGDGPAGTGVESVGRATELSSSTATGGLSELDQDLARLSLSGQNWSQNPTSYIRSEIRGLTNPLHMPSGPPQYQALDEINTNRAKRYSSQRQRNVQETPPLHLGVMEGHYYDPMSYQGPIYAHGEGPAPLPPQGMLVQPEMHLPHPGLHPHQSGAPITNTALYGAPPVSLSPGQPQQLLPPPFYPPPGVMTFPYPAMYPPSPQGQAQVTYGGVTYYDTMQQQAQPKPSPPRRTSQPVTVKAPPPDLSINLLAPPTDLE